MKRLCCLAIARLFFKVFVLAACIQPAFAGINHLSERNLPPGKLIYTNGTDYYYAVVTTHELQSPNERWVKDEDIEFRVIAFRKAQSDGSLVHLLEQKVTDRFGKQVEGYRYHPQETALVNEHLISKIDEQFPDQQGRIRFSRNCRPRATRRSGDLAIWRSGDRRFPHWRFKVQRGPVSEDHLWFGTGPERANQPTTSALAGPWR